MKTKIIALLTTSLMTTSALAWGDKTPVYNSDNVFEKIHYVKLDGNDNYTLFRNRETGNCYLNGSYRQGFSIVDCADFGYNPSDSSDSSANNLLVNELLEKLKSGEYELRKVN